MQTATLELTESQWVRIILALEFKAETDTVNTEGDYLKKLAELAQEIRELVEVQITN